MHLKLYRLVKRPAGPAAAGIAPVAQNEHSKVKI
jgi:hypothetical protein